MNLVHSFCQLLIEAKKKNLASKVKQENRDVIWERLLKKWQKIKEDTPEYLRHALAENPPDVFTQQQYYNIVRSVLEYREQPADTAGRLEECSVNASSVDVSEGSERALDRTSVSSAPPTASRPKSIVFVGAMQLLTDHTIDGELVNYEAFLNTSNPKFRDTGKRQ